MKLARVSKPLRSVQVRVMLAVDLNASLEHYARYYEHFHGEPVDSRWCSFQEFCAPSCMQTASSSRGRAPVPAISHAASSPRLPRTAASRHRRDLPPRGTGRRASHVFTTDTSLIAGMNANGASTSKHCVDAVYRNTCEAVQVPAKSA